MTIKRINLDTIEGFFRSYIVDTKTGVYIGWNSPLRESTFISNYDAGIDGDKINKIIKLSDDEKKEKTLENITSEQLLKIILPYISAKKFNKMIEEAYINKLKQQIGEVKQKIKEFEKIIEHINFPTDLELKIFINKIAAK